MDSAESADVASRSAKRLKPEGGGAAPDESGTAEQAGAAPHFYPIGTPGEAWGDRERAQWLKRAGIVKRSYADEVLAKLEPLKSTYTVEQYGALSHDPARYPLFVIKTRDWDPSSKPSLLVTGGTHGYETSGVQGALLFAQTAMAKYADRFNIAVVPCVSPWSYECMQRWNPKTIDPNRWYVADSPAEECAFVLDLVASLSVPQWTCHLDLHETTDTDLEEFMPAKASRDGLPNEDHVIPDGFYLMGCAATPQPEWHKAMIDAVREVTHIAPADAASKILGVPITQEGVVVSDPVGKGKGVASATYATTTEVYPDSKSKPVTGEQCNRAQVAAIVGGLEYIIALAGKK
mmetsp:Transcript_67558/g.197717  ORF Transcript_67558/g.197717 Transcript_67558/m.197717 type:complete len:348 (+) Transcript_67558:266-1309(+)